MKEPITIYRWFVVIPKMTGQRNFSKIMNNQNDVFQGKLDWKHSVSPTREFQHTGIFAPTHSWLILTARKRSLGQGNVLLLSVCSRGGKGGGRGGLCMISLPFWLSVFLVALGRGAGGSLSLVPYSFQVVTLHGEGSLSGYRSLSGVISVTLGVIVRSDPLYGRRMGNTHPTGMLSCV